MEELLLAIALVAGLLLIPLGLPGLWLMVGATLLYSYAKPTISIWTIGALTVLALIAELMGHATQKKYEYRHQWQMGDMVIWDNLCSMHRGGDYEYESCNCREGAQQHCREVGGAIHDRRIDYIEFPVPDVAGLRYTPDGRFLYGRSGADINEKAFPKGF